MSKSSSKPDRKVSRAPTSTAPHVVEPDGEVTLSIDGIEVTVLKGTTILEAAKKIGVRIPTLCYHKDLCIAGVCRICVVEVDGFRTLHAACAYPIEEPITVRNHTRRVRQARRHILDLMLSKHYGECYSCSRNGNCELQSLAKEYGVDFYRFGHLDKPIYEIDHSSPAIIRDMNKCILCRRCIRTCIDMQEVGALEVAHRSVKSKVGTFHDKPLADVVCINCGQCNNRCPTAAIRKVNYTDEVWTAIDDPEKHVVIQTAPAPRAAIAESFDLEPGTPMTFEMNTALKLCGFDRVFDTNFAADLTIMEEVTELVSKLYKKLVNGDKSVSLPQFTSCSPGWIKYIEHFYPDHLPYVSTCKSPQQMFGSLIKTYYASLNGIDAANIVSVSLMPCTAKKYECNRQEMCSSGFKDIDYALTTRELAQMFKETGIDLPAMKKSDFDNPFGTATGSGVIFGATGGVMESALRTAFELITGKQVEELFENAEIKPVRGFEGSRIAELTIEDVGPVPDILKNKVPDWNWLKGVTLKLGMAHGTANAKRVMEDIISGGIFSQCHFIEFMACVGGCLGGGGQPIPTTPEIREARAKAIYAEDRHYETRKSYENPAVLKLYDKFLSDGPCGPVSHALLHTYYTPRGKYIE